MLEKFAALHPDKQRKIINAALQEFAEHGYNERPPTAWCKRRESGKGCYRYLIDYSLHVVRQQFLERIDTSEPDFIQVGAGCPSQDGGFARSPSRVSIYGHLLVEA